MPGAVASQIAELNAIATELFDDAVRVDCVSDPEIPGREQTVFHVAVAGGTEDVKRLRLEW